MASILMQCAQSNAWGPQLTWIMDLIKTILSVVLAACTAVFFVNRSQRKHAARRDRHNMELQFKLDCLQEFRRAVYQYESLARDAYTDLYQWKGVNKTDSMQKYSAEAYANYEAALEETQDRFQCNNTLALLVDKLTKSNVKRHAVYDKVKDFIFDTANVDSWGWSDENRKAFDDAFDETEAHRQELISAMRSDIAKFAGQSPS
jgi:hypothetical protein